MEDKIDKKGTLIIKDRRSITLDGVKNIVGFDETYVKLNCDLGQLTVEGENLKIESLTKDDATVVISGIIDGAYFNEQKITKSAFSKLFK